MSCPVLEAKSVHVTYGAGPAACRALNGVSLEVRSGEVLLLMGPSGSGKTTLLQVLGCLLPPDSGSIRLFDRPLQSRDPKTLSRLRLEHYGFVFQSYNLFPTLNAWENVAIALDLIGVRGASAEARARDMLREVGLAAKAEAYPGELSGGQKQRIAIARALATEPEIILADEPTAALDAASGQAAISLLASLARSRGRAVVVVTHDPRVLPYGDRVVRLEDGRIMDTPRAH
jgi:putative ABC transport system ATP-binding protein